MIRPVRVNKRNLKSVMNGKYKMTTLLIEGALDLGYGVEVFKGSPVFRVTKGKKSVVIHGITPAVNTSNSVMIADNKYFTNSILGSEKLPVPHSVVVAKEAFQKGRWSMQSVRFPVVVKPMALTLKGSGVVTDIRTKKELLKYLRDGFQSYDRMMVEEYYSGMEDYRILVIDGKVKGVLHRVRAHVIGDGIKSIEQLIRMRNKERKAFTQMKMGPISVDQELKNSLKRQKLTMRSVPKEGEEIILKNVCNMGAGGDTDDVTSKIHPANKKLAIAAASALGLRVSGVDLLCSDISKPVTRGKRNGVILEVNHRPDLGMHHFPRRGTPRNSSKDVMEVLFD